MLCLTLPGNPPLNASADSERGEDFTWFRVLCGSNDTAFDHNERTDSVVVSRILVL